MEEDKANDSNRGGGGGGGGGVRRVLWKSDEDITPYLYAYITNINTGYLSQLL